jgi:HD-like signal output (HDOD) protein
MLASVANTATELPNLSIRMRMEIREIGIPPRPSILSDIDDEMVKEEPDFIRLSKIISSDVALAASLIKTTNSPFYGFSKKVRTVYEAMLVLGLKLVTRTIAGLALQKVFPYVPSLERFWDTAASTARVSGWITHRIQGHCVVRSADAYTFALFRDGGIPVLLIPFPEYLSVLQQANIEETLSFTDVEDQSLSINHADVGADLAENWLLPEDICLAIRRHHDPVALNESNSMELPISSRQLIAVAQLAEFLIQEQSAQNLTREWGKLGLACMRILNITPDEIAKLVHEYRSNSSTIAAFQ